MLNKEEYLEFIEIEEQKREFVTKSVGYYKMMYPKLGENQIKIILHSCLDLGIPFSQGLKFMYVRGDKIEMGTSLMSNLILSKKHKIVTIQSNHHLCHLKGIRSDTGLEDEAQFSLNDAKKAGLVKPNTPWESYTDQMLYARCLSKLARRLFNDCIGGSYVQGELSDIKEGEESDKVSKSAQWASKEELEALKKLLEDFPEEKEKVESYLEKNKQMFETLPKRFVVRMLTKLEDMKPTQEMPTVEE